MVADNSSLDVISLITYLFFIYLILAIFIERMVEVFMSILYYIDLKFNGYTFWNKLAKKYKLRLDNLYDFQGNKLNANEKMFNWILWEIVTEKNQIGGKNTISSKAIRTKYFRMAGRVFAFLLSLAFAIAIKIKLDTDLISLFEKVSGIDLLLKQFELRIFLTAVALSIGSEPLHSLIVKFESIGKEKVK
jgi:hypothetical protein